ncbi:hypothetical protein [Sphingomonas oryzagri]
MHRISALAPILLLLCGTAALAEKDDGTARRAPLLQKVVDCRGIADSAQRLACYDSTVSALDSAEARHDIAVVSRVEVQQSRQALFGFRLPSLAIFGHGDPREHGQEDELKEITAKVTGVTQGAYGIYIVTLEGGAVWQQNDSTTMGRRPRVGDTAKVTRGALGSYRIVFNGGQGFKVVRTQ